MNEFGLINIALFSQDERMLFQNNILPQFFAYILLDTIFYVHTYV